MKYKIGDKVRIKKCLFVGNKYGRNTYVEDMDAIVKNYDYILTIGEIYNNDGIQYNMLEDGCCYCWTEEMIEGIAELVEDREKFEGWMRKLGRIDGGSDVWKAFDKLTYLDPDDEKETFEEALKTVTDYLFVEKKKKMTKAEIEKELGYKFELIEGE